jgi:hypothetical protein
MPGRLRRNPHQGTESSIDPDFRRDSSFPATRTSYASPGLNASRTGQAVAIDQRMNFTRQATA